MNKFLNKKALEINLDDRSKYLRKLIVQSLIGGGRGHMGSAMSLVEILRVLYDKFIKFDPKNLKKRNRDRLILSKGHGCLALYSILVDQKFFSKELLTLLNLIDRNLIFIDTLFGSWAGAFGNFQFMPSTIDQYAIDYDNNKKIDLKNSLDDSVASAANYINKIGWKAGSPCFYKVKVTKKINDKYINTSAKNIKNKLSIKTWKKKGIVFIDDAVVEDTEKAALILPDGNAESTAFLVFDNYEKILMWNRSLRFGVTVCTLSNLIKDEI